MSDQSKPTPESEPKDPVLALDPWSTDALHLKPDFAEDIGVARVLVMVPVRKPKKQEWVRVHPDPQMQAEVLILEDEINKEPFYLHPGLKEALGTECKPMSLHLAITRQHALFLWPCQIQNPEERPNHWHTTRRDAVERAKVKWTQVRANQAQGYYDILESNVEAEPKWPDLTFKEIFKLAFERNIIDSTDHAVVRQILGRE